MELWFWAAIVGMTLMGLANFVFKLAAKRGYDGSAFSFFGAVTTIPPIIVLALFLSTTTGFSWPAFLFAAASGSLGAINNVCKVLALQYIDTTIYFPLFKLFSPLLAIMFGVVLFQEQFTNPEWIGLLLGLFVPLILITPSENKRQQNLFRGLLLILVTATCAASGAAFMKYATELWPNIGWFLVAQTCGVLLGSVITIALQNYRKFKILGQKEVLYSGLAFWGFVRSAVMTLAMFFVAYAYIGGGTLAVVHTITSMYILIPIILAIIFYNEHWNLQKIVAIILSVASLALLG